MKKNIFITFILITIISANPIFSQKKSVLDFDLVPKDQLKSWVENYGFSKLDVLAESGDPVAQRRLGRYYSSVKKDSYTAVKWYKKGAENGDLFAIANLGSAYHVGKGIEQSAFDALWWYDKAFKLDSKNIAHVVTNMNTLKGRTWTNKYRASWYLEDAPRGNELSQYYLGNFYENGFGGLSKNLTLSKKWYKRAANLGFKPAIKALKRINDEEDEEDDVIETVLESTETDSEVSLEIKKEYHSNGKLKSKGYYNAKGKKTGVWTEIDKDGSRHTGSYVNGKLDGKWKSYYSNGSLFFISYWDNEEKVGDWKLYYDTGELYMLYEYRKGAKTGSYTEYHKNGKYKNSGFIIDKTK